MGGSAWYRVPLQCTHCRVVTAPGYGSLSTRAIDLYPGDIWVAPGELLEIGLEDLADAFAPVSSWPPPHPLTALESWTCGACGRSSVALTTWRSEAPAGWRLLSAEAVALTDDLLARIDGLSTAVQETLDDAQLELLATRRARERGA